MIKKFDVEFLEDAFEFLNQIDEKAREKIIFNIDKAKILNDPKVFKKLDSELWEFRAESKKLQYRLIAFWNKRDGRNTLVVCTHGFIKKTDKVPAKELNKARELMIQYFKQIQ
jgi:phage-related protein